MKQMKPYRDRLYLLSLLRKGDAKLCNIHIKGNLIYRKFIEEYNITSYCSSYSFYKFNKEYDMGPPHKDHSALFKTAHGKIIYTTQPYSLTEDKIKEIYQWGNKYNLEVTIMDPSHSWHCNGSTWLVMVNFGFDPIFNQTKKTRKIFGTL